MKPYSATNKEKNAKFKEKAFRKKEESSEEASSEEIEMATDVTQLEGPFAVVDPIDTCIGPIGRFQLVEESFPTHPSVVLFGKRRTGKSFSLRDMLFHCFRDVPFGVVLTRTRQSGFWQQYFPSKFVYQDLRTDIMEAVIRRQVNLIEKWKKENPKGDYKAEPSLRCLVVLGKFHNNAVSFFHVILAKHHLH